MISLSSDKGELLLAPEHGGCVSALRWNGADVLRPFDERLGDDSPATSYAAFPLFPFSGRIANGRFSFDGSDYNVPPNFPPEPHAIHGKGWQMPWNVVERNGKSAHLEYEANGPDWPWTYRAEQGFALTDRGLRVDLLLTNLSDRPMPGGMGWHPYFPRGDARLEADVSQVWLSGQDMIPGAPSPLTEENDLSLPRPVKDLQLDNAFSAGSRGARMVWGDADLSVVMTASETLRHLIVYTPPGEDYFCVEPVSHAPDAVNSNQPHGITGLSILQPGETLAASVSLIIED